MKAVGFSLAALLSASSNGETYTYPNSCVGLEDGTHQLKLMDGDYPIVEVECSNDYMILNVKTEDNLKEYFSSWAMWHYALAGPSNNGNVNWNNWFLPSNGEVDSIEYVMSGSCSSCTDSTDSFGDTAYYMTGNMFGCFWKIRGLHDCDMDFDTYECYECSCSETLCEKIDIAVNDDGDMSDTSGAMDTTGTCGTLPKSVTTNVVSTHDSCSGSGDGGGWYKPSLGTDGSHCVCAKPVADVSYYTNDINYDEQQAIKLIKDTAELESKTFYAEIDDHGQIVPSGSIDDVYYLTQSDFTEGTYRIVKSGTYILEEDIIFDFNAGELNNQGAWMPHESQIDKYPGAEQMRDPYFLGFFAGITIETQDVILDLNGKTLKQSNEFYFQQRWFSLIELANQAFLPAQGPGMFGDSVSSASNVEIKNGVLGLSAHHAIHGNRVKNIKIHDVEIRDFETHGIQINGFDGLEIYNVEIHTTSTRAYLKGEYGHARFTLPRLAKIAEEEGDKTVTFAKDKSTHYTAQDIHDSMQQMIDIAYEYVVNENKDIKNEISEELWQEVKDTFLYLDEDDEIDDITENNDAAFSNSNGLPYGTSMYGIMLSFDGANVFSWGSSNLKSYNANIHDVKIHGLRHKMHEYVRFNNDIPFDVNIFNAVFDVLASVSDVNNIDGASYVGNIMTDAYIAMNYLTNDWGYLQLQNFDDGRLEDWALGKRDLDSDEFTPKCNADVMTHSGKGIVGIRMDGIEGFEMKNIEVYDMYDFTKLGTDTCGEYSYGHFSGTGHFLQKEPMQSGFSGNMMSGISLVGSTGSLEEIYVHDIGSATGLAHGLAIMVDNDIELNGNIINKNIKAGFQLDTDTFTYDARPNKAPEACGIKTYYKFTTSTSSDVLETTISTSDESNLNIMTECVTGHTGCFDTELFSGASLGTYKSCDEQANQAILDDYLKDIDSKLLNKKDITMTLKDPKDRTESMSIADSQTIFDSTVYADMTSSSSNNMSPPDAPESPPEAPEGMPDKSGQSGNSMKAANKNQDSKKINTNQQRDGKTSLNVDVTNSDKNHNASWMNTTTLVILGLIGSFLLISLYVYYSKNVASNHKKLNGQVYEPVNAYGSL